MRAPMAAALLATVFMLAFSTPLDAERYSLSLRRIERDLYRDARSKAIVETRYCYEYAYGDDAILNWEGRSGNNWVIFTVSGKKCDVVAIR